MPKYRTGREREYVYKSTLRTEYGLTPKMVEELGPPDEWRDNPHYKSGPPASLYLIPRVEAWVANNRARLDKAKEQRARRSTAARAANECRLARQRQQTEEWVKSVPIVIRTPLPPTLLADVCKACQLLGDAYDLAYDKVLPYHKVHEYVRLRLTNYHALLREMSGREFTPELVPVLKRRVDSVVASALREWAQQSNNEGMRLARLAALRHFIGTLPRVQTDGDGPRVRLSTRLPRVPLAAAAPEGRAELHGETAAGTGAVAGRPTAKAEAARRARRTFVSNCRRIGWRGRKLVKAAVRNAKRDWRVAASTVQALLGVVPAHNSSLGPLLVHCMAMLQLQNGSPRVEQASPAPCEQPTAA